MTLPLTLMAIWSSLLLGGLAEDRPTYESVLIENVPHVQQKPDFCGEACAAMWLGKLGHETDQDAIFDLSGVDPAQGRGAFTAEMVRALKRLGFDPGRVWEQVDAEEAGAELQAAFGRLIADLYRGVPSIVCTHYDDQPRTTEHFRLVLGYDARTDELIYHEPAVAQGAYRRMKRDLFLKLWPLKYDPKTWTIIRMRLSGRDLKVPPPSRTPTAADRAQAVMRARRAR